MKRIDINGALTELSQEEFAARYGGDGWEVPAAPTLDARVEALESAVAGIAGQQEIIDIMSGEAI